VSKPVIGITCSSIGNVGSSYLEAVRMAGGIPLAIPCGNEGDAETLIGRVDGLLIPGGADLHPRFYGEEPHPNLGNTNEHRDQEEIALLHWALLLDMPVLGVCRGMQALNVACGGSLWQDIYSQRPTDIDHVQPGDYGRGKTSHKIYVKPGGLFNNSTDTIEMKVNSYHHQSVRRLGHGLVVDAVAPDGIVEAISLPEKRYVLGVQFHPEETQRTGERSRLIFKSFIQAAQR